MNSTFINTFINTFKKSFSLEGRSSRREYWQFGFIILNAWAIFCILPSSLHPDTTFALISEYFIAICLFAPSYSISARRFHDLGHSGWFVLLTFIPIVGFFLGLYPLFRAGDKEANQYGPPVIDYNLTGFDKIWLWAFILILLWYTMYIGYKFYLLFHTLQIPATS